MRASVRGHVATLARSDVLALFVASRISFLVLTYLGVVLIHDARILGTPHVSFTLPLMDHWFHWDSMWYIQIARHGYAWSGFTTQSPLAHFPLFPLLISDLTLTTALPDKLIAMLLSNGCFAAALLILHRLCRSEFADPGVAWRAVLYLSVFPTALFFFAPYSESLFLLLELAGFDAMRRGRWRLAALWCGLAAITRPPGVLLALPFAWEYMAHHRWRLRSIRADAAGLLVIPAALAGYMFFQFRVSGDALGFVHHAVDWQRGVALPWQPIADSIGVLRAAPAYSFFQAHNLIELIGVAIFVVLLVYGRRRVPISFSLYAVACLLLVLITPTHTGLPLTSVSRYLAAIFPAFIILAVAGRHTIVHNVYMSIAPGLLALFTVIFLNGGWVA